MNPIWRSLCLPSACRWLESTLPQASTSHRWADPTRPQNPKQPPLACRRVDEPCPRYRLLERLGRGGTAEVFRAVDRHGGRLVALKLLRRWPASGRLQRRFLYEAQVTAALDHPGILRVEAYGFSSRGRPFLVLPLLEGATLQQRLAACTTLAGRLSCGLPVLRRVSQALAHAHAQGVIHRDVKPSNIMVGPGSQVHLMDWGLARQTGTEEPAGRQPRGPLPAADGTLSFSALTVPGCPLGTPAYMAPEQARGHLEQLGPASDVFALGAVLCQVLTGLPPYGAEPRQALRRAIRACPEEAWRRLALCGAPRRLVELCRWCLCPDPTRRPEQAAQVAEALAQAV